LEIKLDSVFEIAEKTFHCLLMSEGRFVHKLREFVHHKCNVRVGYGEVL
jgi:hypothetical protein